MPIIHFYAWINKNDPADPGHLVLFDCQEYRTLEITRVASRHDELLSRYTAKDSHLELTQESLRESAQAQVRRERGGRTRFTHVYKVAVRVTDAEFTEMRGRLATAVTRGDAQMRDPVVAGRCLLPLEVLASRRGQRDLQGANAFEFLKSFARSNPTSCFSEDGADLSQQDRVTRLFGPGVRIP